MTISSLASVGQNRKPTPRLLDGKGSKRGKSSRYRGLCLLPQELKDPIVFFGGRSYVCPDGRSPTTVTLLAFLCLSRHNT